MTDLTGRCLKCWVDGRDKTPGLLDVGCDEGAMMKERSEALNTSCSDLEIDRKYKV